MQHTNVLVSGLLQIGQGEARCVVACGRVAGKHMLSGPVLATASGPAALDKDRQQA